MTTQRSRHGAARRTIGIAAIACLAASCGPSVDDDPEPLGTLEFERPNVYRIYRLDRRVDVVFEDEHGGHRECGLLIDQAHDDLESTIEALDPSVDYGYDPDILECDAPGSWVHIEGFEHSPFECSSTCCRTELRRAALLYSVVMTHFYGEPDPIIEPDQPCP